MKPLAVTLGDPAGIGPEVVLKAVAAVDVPVWLFGSRRWTERSGALPPVERFIDVPGSGELRFGEISAEYGRVALDSIEQAVEAVEQGRCAALVTAPIQKQAVAAAGSPHPGHTELLAARAGLARYGRDFAMYFDSPSIRTVLLSVHVPLWEALASITPEGIADLAALTRREYGRLHGTAPRIAVAGVNPHAGEGGLFGNEEERIARGVDAARRAGIDASGPHPADTVFLAARNGAYDVVMAMYHDQGLIAVKTLDFERAVNVTIGLPYLRCSVDHGTAFDIAGRGAADPRPMRNAIEWAARHAARWER
ncbi:MAG TPA: 4-hydroxythreonine-4-phosphate dehydrogenase PdxA [Thermoanaerobaculia bacterium]|nr:4-hydroxythreonine-4-phosphate dehydrogenase PdxA [Thermoanaerobaculia bacterium]